MLTSLISRLLVLSMGTAYPAYRSYKAIQTKNLTEYLSCLRYWIVFACFILVESICDTFICWIPLYYEFKILLICCLLTAPGSRIIYKNMVQPTIVKHEAQIDRFIERTRNDSYAVILNAGTRLMKYGSDMFINTAFRRDGANSLTFPGFLIGTSLSSGRQSSQQQPTSLTRSASTNNVYRNDFYDQDNLDENYHHQRPFTISERYTNSNNKDEVIANSDDQRMMSEYGSENVEMRRPSTYRRYTKNSIIKGRA